MSPQLRSKRRSNVEGNEDRRRKVVAVTHMPSTNGTVPGLTAGTYLRFPKPCPRRKLRFSPTESAITRAKLIREARWIYR
jgi:hypothetical protein